MKKLKFLSLFNISFVIIIVLLAYINGLGCNYTMKYWLPKQPFSIYSTCSSGKINIDVVTVDFPSESILEINGTLFSLGDYQFLVVENIDKMALNMSKQYPFKQNLLNRIVISATIKRFNTHWVGIFSDIPLNTAFLAEIEGPLNMQERLSHE